MAERFASPEIARALGRRIAYERCALGKTQGELGIDADVGRTLVTKLEGGHVQTINDSVQKICTLLNLDPRNPGGDLRLDAVLRRLSDLARKTPAALTAIDSVLDALEAAGRQRA